LAALLGALDALHNRYAAFFGYPKAHILFVTEEDHLRIVAENKGLVALRIVNLSQSVSVLAHFEEAILYQADQINRVPETVIRIPDLVVPVDTGDADTVELYVSNPPPPGRYWISVTALMKGGLVWGRETITVVRDIGVFGKIGRNRIRNAGVRCSNHLSGTILRIAATGYLRKPQRIHPESNVSAGDRV